jgi:hypothetical protein
MVVAKKSIRLVKHTEPADPPQVTHFLETQPNNFCGCTLRRTLLVRKYYRRRLLRQNDRNIKFE